MLGEPVLTHRVEGGVDVPLLVWRLPEPALAISSGVLGGGIGACDWVVNASVPMSYDRDDPADHLAEMAAGVGLTGPGVGLMTGVDVADVVAAEEDGVLLWATVGLGAPILAASASAVTASGTTATTGGTSLAAGGAVAAGGASDTAGSASVTAGNGVSRPGTVNVVAWVPQRLSDGALVNAVATITEAKAQALRDLGLDATGTATDAVCVLCPPDGPVAAYAGPRSRWGAPMARAAHRAVRAGGAVNLAGTTSWSDRQANRRQALD